MIGPTKNLTILTCDRQVENLWSHFTSFKIAKHPGTLANVLAAFNEVTGEVELFSSNLTIPAEYLHSDIDEKRAEGIKIKSFVIIEGDWLAILVLSDGRIYRGTVDEFSVTSAWTFEQIGAVENGISAAEWSPDHSILVLITGVNRRILLTRDFEPIEEGPVQVEDFGTEEMISIGWGKKETQFHGTLGKSAAIAVAQIKMESVEGDSGDAKLSWRADGSYFAVSILDAPECGRRIRVYDRTGNLLSTSEPVEGLEESLAWRPNGSIIASTQFLKSQNKRQVIFFERNGLRHGEFILAPNRRVKDLAWSADSNVLGVVYETEDVELWASSNYHWYLKSKLPCGPTRCISWDPEKLIISTVNEADMHVFTLVWDQLTCDSCVAVIDGAYIHLTPLAICNIPPPMSLFQMKLSNVPSAVALKSYDGKLFVAAALSDSLEIYSVSLSVKRSLCTFELIKKFAFDSSLIQLEAFSDGFFGSNLLGTECFLFKLREDDFITIPLPEKCSRILSNCGQVLFSDGTIHKISKDSLEFVSILDELNSRTGEWIELLEKEGVYLIMNEKGWLWANGNLIMTQATSFACLNQFILITTHTHQLIFLPRDGTSIDYWESLAKLALDGQNGNEELQRRVERGALLVCAIPEISGVVLQMPRGNLETIHPRAMVLASLRQFLNALEYKSAYALCRRHRIDLNILHDHAPELFLQTIGKFVKDLESVDHLNIFLSSLKDEDVSKTKYSGFTSKITGIVDSVIGAKINTVSEAILKVLKEDSLNWIDSIMTVYVVQQPPRLEEALSCIIELAESGKPAENIEKSMKYLLFLVPAEKLFDVALGMFKLPLALSIGRRSQKDPKDFEPFLEELAVLPEIDRNFRINDHLQRYPEALKCLFLQSTSQSDEFLVYMQKYQLYKEAIEISSSNPTLYKDVLDLFGNNLMTNGENSSAVCCFRRSGNWEKVIEASILSGSWIEFIDAMRKLGDISTFVNESKIDTMISTLKSQGRQKEAIQFCKLTGVVPDQKIVSFSIESGLFSEAVLIQSTASSDETFLLALNSHGEKLLLLVKELSDDFNNKTQRIIRIQRTFLTSDTTNINYNNSSGNDMISDNVSEMSFRTTNSTIKTRTTNSSRRSGSSVTSSKKAERNRTRDRPGSPHEREFLLFNIRELISKIHKLSPEVKETLKNLVEFNDERDVSLNLPRSISSFYKSLCDSVLKFVEEFRRLEVPKITLFNGNGEATTENGTLIENPLIDPLDAKFELPPDFSLGLWSIKLF